MEMSKTDTVADMIMEALHSAERPLTSGDLYERLEIDNRDTVIHRAISNLLQYEWIEIAGAITNKKNMSVKTYRIKPAENDVTNLLNHLEHELSESAEIDNADIRTRLIKDDGDEFHECHIGIPPRMDPIVAAIHRISTPKWGDGGAHAIRLRALAMSQPIATNDDVSSWLMDLATILEGMSA